MKNPFKKWSTSYHDWEVLKDLKWHCTKCELKSGQAKTWQVWRQEKWIHLDTDEKWNYYKIIFCPYCNMKTVHRKLKDLKIDTHTKARSWISPKIAKRVKELYNFKDAIVLRKLPANQLEVDHKFPQIRWNEDEKSNDNLSDEQLREKFILLSRSNNLWKSRQCEKCFKTWIRWKFPGINFYYKWNEKWEWKDNYDENGCVWCFWYDPYKWREELNKRLSWKK